MPSAAFYCKPGQFIEFNSFKFLQRFRNINTGGSFSLSNKYNIIVALCEMKGIILRWKENHEWKELVIKRDVIF